MLSVISGFDNRLSNIVMFLKMAVYNGYRCTEYDRAENIDKLKRMLI